MTAPRPGAGRSLTARARIESALVSSSIALHAGGCEAIRILAGYSAKDRVSLFRQHAISRTKAKITRLDPRTGISKAAHFS